jgi:hypothetical protein
MIKLIRKGRMFSSTRLDVIGAIRSSQDWDIFR